jgi:hypothetical protein
LEVFWQMYMHFSRLSWWLLSPSILYCNSIHLAASYLSVPTFFWSPCLAFSLILPQRDRSFRHLVACAEPPTSRLCSLTSYS